MPDNNNFLIQSGSPFPLGPSKGPQGFNFSVISGSAKTLSLCLIDRNSRKLVAEIPFSPQTNKTGNVWHIAIDSLPDNLVYAYKTDCHELLLDPYAKGVLSHPEWRKPSNDKYVPLGELIVDSPFDWEGDQLPAIPIEQLIIYEMHVRGFTAHASSHAKLSGTFLGVIEKIPHLLDLGVNAVELLPVFEFNEMEYRSLSSSKQSLCNFWGYSTVNFFSPMARYASSPERGKAIHEFKTMVKELHRHGIEVILDVVYNHTAEGNKNGPTLSFKGLDPSTYYMLDAKKNYLNYSGCGNTFNCNHPVAVKLILDSLRYWRSELHVDGFRFDLASILTRDIHGHPQQRAPIVEAITHDPLLAGVKLIAEPWDAAGLYQVGAFAPESARWMEWNDKFRDGVRRFIKGTATNGEFARRLCGSDDLYHFRGPCSSINFITAHDGFTLADLVSFNKKHNQDNGEGNRDGTNDNKSWNCGVEGETVNQKVLVLRERQRRNFHLALMLSLGVPMLLMGDEYGHTTRGNNNIWCQEEANLFRWDKLEKNQDFYRFYKGMIQFRKQHPCLERTTFLTPEDIEWHGTEPGKPPWDAHSPFIAFSLKDRDNHHELYAAFNPQPVGVQVKLPTLPPDQKWRWVANTSAAPPGDFFEPGQGPALAENKMSIAPYSAVLLVKG